ncbi:MAG TPA: YciI family protein [Lysobacter sp.]
MFSRESDAAPPSRCLESIGDLPCRYERHRQKKRICRVSIWLPLVRRLNETRLYPPAIAWPWAEHPSTGDKAMRFLSMIRINENAGMQPSEQLMADMGKLMEEMTAAGVLLDTAGLRPTSDGVRVRLSGGKLSVKDGPFTETKEVIGGYAIIKADSKDEAIELTKRFLKVHGDEWVVECEVRQLEEPDFGCAA